MPDPNDSPFCFPPIVGCSSCLQLWQERNELAREVERLRDQLATERVERLEFCADFAPTLRKVTMLLRR